MKIKLKFNRNFVGFDYFLCLYSMCFLSPNLNWKSLSQILQTCFTLSWTFSELFPPWTVLVCLIPPWTSEPELWYNIEYFLPSWTFLISHNTPRDPINYFLEGRNLLRKMNMEILHLACALMKQFLNEAIPLRKWMFHKKAPAKLLGPE